MSLLNLLIFTIVFFILVIILIKESYWLLFAVIILSIFLNYPLGISILGLPLTTQKVGMLIAVVFLFPLLFSNRVTLSDLSTPVTGPFIFLVFIVFLSALRAKYTASSMEGLFTVTVIFIGVHILSILIKISNAIRIKQILTYGITSIFTLLFILAITQFLREGGILNRISGTFTNPNAFGATVLMVIPLLMAEIEGEDIKLTWLGGICLTLALITIYLTYSRATYLSTIFLGCVVMVGNAVFAYKDRTTAFNRRIWIGLVVVLIMGVILFRVVPQDFFERGIERYQSIFANDGLNIQASSIRKRYYAIGVALKYFRENPILGIGIKNFEAYSPGVFGVGTMTATENTYLNILSEIGIIGFGIFIYILYKIFRQLIYNQKVLKTDFLKRLNKYLIFGFITFLFLMLTNDFLDDITSFWIWVIIVMSLEYLDKKILLSREFSPQNSSIDS